MMPADGGESSAAFATLFEESPMGIARLDGSGAIVCCNGVLARMLGTVPDALKGRAFADTFAAEDRDDVRAQLAKLVMGATRKSTTENLRLTATGQGGGLAVQLFATVIEHDGELSGLLVHVLDKTDRYNFEVGLAHSQKLQALGQLAGSIAHDFNNLITAMLGSCEMLLRDSRPGFAGYDDLSDIRSTALRARDLVRQLLSFARKQPLRPIPLRLDRAIEDLLPMLRRLLGAGISIETRHAPRLPLARMDPGRFDQVIVNLAVNARDAMQAAGRLTLSTKSLCLTASTQLSGQTLPAGTYVQVNVSDTGAGIPKEIIDDIFQPFFTTKPQGEGTGLGLATVYGIIRQSSGHISVESALGAGATFHILLPAAEPAADPVRPADSPATIGMRALDPPQRREANILLIEDEQVVRRFAARALRGHGWSVTEAADGKSALKALANEATFDVLLSDLTLPDMSGLTVIEQARRRHPQLPIVIISADLADEARDNKRFQLPKPFSLAELVSFVERVLAETNSAKSADPPLYPHSSGA